MLQLRADTALGSGDLPTFGAWNQERRVATLVLRTDAVASALLVTVAEPPRCTWAECGDLLDAVVAHASSIPVSTVEVATVDPLLRHAGAAAGFERQLRRPLRYAVGLSGVEATPAETTPPGPADPEALARALASLLGVGVTVVPASGWISRLARGAVGGLGDMVRWQVDPGDRRPTLALTAPNRADVMIESVALTVHVALAVRRRFGTAIDHLRTLSFDQSSHGLKGGHHAGEAHANASLVSVNASFVLARMLDERRQQWRSARDGGESSEGPAYLPPPYTGLERTTAHELWHQIEAGFEARRYRESVEFRRQLGLHLGVETLEHAIRGRQAGTPSSWQAAQGQLVEEVSDYAGTLPHEATAEMFAHWWCPVREPSPIVSLFATLVDRYFPPPT